MKTFNSWLRAAGLCLIAVIAFAACSKDDDNEKVEEIEEVENYAPGEIPGLGEADGELTGKPFQLPDGVELIDQITGSGSQYDYWNTNRSAESTTYPFKMKNGDIVYRTYTPVTRAGEVRHYFGSGFGFVDLLIPMRNTLSGSVTVTFPAATIMRSMNENCQNGVLIKKVTVTIPAKSDYYLCLAFYCGNEYRGAAGGTDKFELAVVSDAAPLLELCDRVKNKKINLEEYSPTDADARSTYFEIALALQGIVWAVTDGKGLTEAYISFINSLPNS